MVNEHEALLARMRALSDEAKAAGDVALIQEMRAMLDSDATVPESANDEIPVWNGIVGSCSQLVAMRPRIERFAAVDAPVLIRGESGTGKDLVAHALHDLGPRHAKPFVSENCAAIPESLLESVLFGHVKGSFTGAVRDHPGHFVSAHTGTLFLDEIGDMPLAMQVKLLRVLQEGEVRPVGGSKVKKINVRVIAATNRDLEAMVGDGSFREDLFYRLNVLELDLPPLRERGQDIAFLARRFLATATSKSGRPLMLAAEAEEALMAAPWPGNVRQLQNEIQRLVALADGPIVRPEDLALPN